MRTERILAVIGMIVVAGCGGGGDDRVEAQVISGFGSPVGYAQVLVSGKDEPIQADEDGRLSFSAGGHYDVSVLDPSANVVYVFQGLSKRHPRLVLVENVAGVLDGSVRITTLGGTTAGNPTLAGAFIPAGRDEYAGGVSFGFGDTIDIHPAWVGTETQITGNAPLLQYQRGPASDRRPTGYFGQAKPAVTITAFAIDTSFAPVTLQPVTESEMTITQTAPGGFTPSSYTVLATIDDYAFINLSSYGSTAATVTWPTPDIEGYTFRATARAIDDAGTTLTSVAAGIAANGSATLTHMVPAAVASPVDGGAWTPVTPVSWNEDSTAGLFVAILRDAAFVNGEGSYPPITSPTVQVYTSDSSFVLPDLAPLGIDVPTDRPYAIDLSATTTYEDVDDYASPLDFGSVNGSFQTSFSSIVVNP